MATTPSPSPTPPPRSPTPTTSNSPGTTPKRRTPQRTSSGDRGLRKDDELTKTILALKAELNVTTVKHREELYWLKLELDTTRLEKEAVEDRMAELYRDMQELDEIKKAPVAHARGGKFHLDDMKEMQKHLQKYEKMVRIMNNQIGLLRGSTDTVLKSLKDEISDLMDEKSRMELNLLNKLSDMDKENRELKVQLEVAQQGQKAASKEDLSLSPHQKSAQASGSASADIKQLQDEIKHLRHQNRKKEQELAMERQKVQETISKVDDEKINLSHQVEYLQQELRIAHSSSEAISAMDHLQQNHAESAAILDRLAQMWDQAEESIQNLGGLTTKLGPGDDSPTEDQDRLLTVLETASLVHGQIKISLMLVELKIRNSLASLWSDRSQLGPLAESDDVFRGCLAAVQHEALEAIEQVKDLLANQMRNLEAQSEEVTASLTQSIESRIGELQRMQHRQSELQGMIENLHASEQAETREVVNEDGTVDMFVSRKVLERLQNEVLQIVDRVREKNEEIGRLTMTVEELKVRERALMDELKRLMQEQSRIEMEERQRRMEAQALKDAENDDDETDSDYEDCSSSAYVEDSLAEEVIEESVMEETIID